MKICKVCGKNLGDNIEYCPQCGSHYFNQLSHTSLQKNKSTQLDSRQSEDKGTSTSKASINKEFFDKNPKEPSKNKPADNSQKKDSGEKTSENKVSEIKENSHKKSNYILAVIPICIILGILIGYFLKSEEPTPVVNESFSGLEEIEPVLAVIEIDSDNLTLKDNIYTRQEENHPTLQDAVKYLDNNSTWSKAAMDTYPDLRGLFEDMNSYNLPRLTSVWKEKLVGSQKFQDIITHAESRMRYDTNQTYRNSTYDTAGLINVTIYKNKLDPGPGNFNKSQNQGSQQGAIQKTPPKSSNPQPGTNTTKTSASNNATTGGSANKENSNGGSKAGVNSGESKKSSGEQVSGFRGCEME